MTEIMKIFDVHTIPNKGVVIGGTNMALNRFSRQEICALIGKQIEIHTLKSTLHANVIGIEVTSSLAGNKNIFILLPQTLNLSDIAPESMVYSGEYNG
jgi:hypothetical protein